MPVIKYPTSLREDWTDEEVSQAQQYVKIARAFAAESSGGAVPHKVTLGGVGWIQIQDNDQVKFVSEAPNTFEASYASQTFSPKQGTVNVDEADFAITQPSPVKKVKKAEARLSKKSSDS